MYIIGEITYLLSHVNNFDEDVGIIVDPPCTDFFYIAWF